MADDRLKALAEALAWARNPALPQNAVSRRSGLFGQSGNDSALQQGNVFSAGPAGEGYDDPVVRTLKSQTQKLIDRYCGPVPSSPIGVSVDDNMGMARRRGFVEGFPSHLYDMYEDFKTGGAMDYKTQDWRYRDFGNFNYGAYSTAAGITPIDTLANAEAYSLYSRRAPDQEEDLDMIRKGIAYAQCRLGR